MMPHKNCLIAFEKVSQVFKLLMFLVLVCHQSMAQTNLLASLYEKHDQPILSLEPTTFQTDSSPNSPSSVPHYINYRGSLQNAQTVFTSTKHGKVAFLGGSISEMKGWHNAVMDDLKQRFPTTSFDFIEAGIGSTGTTPGAFRMEKDVLSKGKIDLLFVEAAVNDHTNGFDSLSQIRGMEGEVRHALLANPATDIIMLHFIYDPFISIFNAGNTPDVILNHEKVATHYHLPSINLAKEIAERMKAGEFDWKTFGGTHPLPFGHHLYYTAIKQLFDSSWSNTNPAKSLSPHIIPKQPLDAYSYFNGNLIDPSKPTYDTAWKLEPNWKPKEAGTVREKFKNSTILEATHAGASLQFQFKGTAVGLYLLAGPNAGIIEYSIDGKTYPPIDLFTQWSSRIYLPWVTMLATELTNTKHTLTLKMAENQNPKSKGKACDIYYFAVNGKE